VQDISLSMQESRTADGNARGTEEPLPTEESGGPHTPSLLDNQCLSVWPAFPQNNKPAWLCSVGSWVGLCSCFSRLPRTGQGLLGELSGLSVRRATRVPDACGRDIHVLNLGQYSNPNLRDQVWAEFIDLGVTSIYSV